ncbi:hypothetical protein A9404_07625 [Halothiobacillus diazotrophicus]|uniref:Two-component system response regulator n=1 Tax=Halothiobacillus diazotrophicus TaxID=1860122 RepID=A0A191ZHC7_9GAMM|nr:EAL domain-containing protein [Halothiobacillus diazotrophicus]ANJ67270.1 hypothetical protein A9404_07625 [Halothiobacillus diazotrophicus]
MFTLDNATPRIFIVDDDASQIVLLNETLKSLGQVLFEQDSRAAFDRIRETRPDVVLLDIEMPELNGFEVLEQLKADEQTRHLPVMFITGHDTVEEQLRCLRAGAVDFIVKPLQPEVVAVRVRTHLTLRARERRLNDLYRHARVTLASIGDAVITTNVTGEVTFMNPMAESLTGINLDKAKGRSIEEIMPLRIGENGPLHVNPIRLAIEGRRMVGMALNCQMQRQTGHWVPVEDSAAPLISETDEVIGSVIVFHEMDEARAMMLKMTHTLQYDQLTNLPNRFLFLDYLKTEIARSQKNEEKLGLIALDINQFKLINEELGFDFGDALLQKVAKRIQGQLHQHEVLSRHHSDQFMVMVPETVQPSDLAVLAEAIKDSVMQLAQLHTELNNFSVCLGISVFPDDAADPETLLLHADEAVYRAKHESALGGVCFFSEEMESGFTSRRLCFTRIKSAIANQGVVVLYQPQINPVSGDVEAVEALMRLRDDDGQLVSPVQFIGLAEETRLIIPLGEQMIRIALDQLGRWCDDGLHIRMCINISPVQFLDAHFLAAILKAIEACGVDPKLVELEVTESLMMKHLDSVRSDMQKLRALGVSISIDDFGTGFSSLSYLRELPVDVLKIDKAFVDPLRGDPSDDVLVRTVATLAKSIGVLSVAEGVETEEQARHLKDLGVSLLQGYHFSRPVPADQLNTRYSL